MAAKLQLSAPSMRVRHHLIQQGADEARHSEVFERYVQRVAGRPCEPPAGPRALLSALDDIEHPVGLLVIHTMLESYALDQFSYLQAAFDGDLLGDIYALVRQDEARHVAFGFGYVKNSLCKDKSDELFDVLRWCEENILLLAQVKPGTFSWIAEASGECSSDVEERFMARHKSRFERMYSHLEGEKKWL